MAQYTIHTSIDFKEQTLLVDDCSKIIVHEPDVCIEDIIAKSVEQYKKDEPGRVYCMHENIKVEISNDEKFQVPTLSQFLLCQELQDSIGNFRSVADVYCGSGFIGTYAGVNKDLKEIFFIDESMKTVRYAMSTFGLNICNDASAAHNNPVTEKKHIQSKINGKTGHFMFGDVTESLRALEKNDPDLILSSIPFIPGIHQGLSHLMIIASYSRKMKKRFAFTYSSLADKYVKKIALDLDASLNRLKSIEKPLVYDSISGPISYPVSNKLARELEPLGLINYGKKCQFQYGHELRVGIMHW